jgi:hypothetical protein
MYREISSENRLKLLRTKAKEVDALGGDDVPLGRANEVVARDLLRPCASKIGVSGPPSSREEPTERVT